MGESLIIRRGGGGVSIPPLACSNIRFATDKSTAGSYGTAVGEKKLLQTITLSNATESSVVDFMIVDPGVTIVATIKELNNVVVPRPVSGSDAVYTFEATASKLNFYVTLRSYSGGSSLSISRACIVRIYGSREALR